MSDIIRKSEVVTAVQKIGVFYSNLAKCIFNVFKQDQMFNLLTLAKISHNAHQALLGANT